ncbi:MAG TPA: hypothetical protein VHW24_19625, partial [Bryobacteraceae bacterium]|nr:hypothetical protein [Bryobacteraceae bacterium]
ARRGLLRQGSILTLTSSADRTSPVIRGKRSAAKSTSSRRRVDECAAGRSGVGCDGVDRE